MFKWFGWINYAPHTRVDAFADRLRQGTLTAARCLGCGRRSFPPQADCAHCLSRAFELVETNGRGTLRSFTTVSAASGGFENLAPYTIGIVDLDEGGSALAWIGDTVPRDSLAIGMTLQLVPRMAEDREDIHLFYSLELPAPLPAPHPRRADEKKETQVHPILSGRLS